MIKLPIVRLKALLESLEGDVICTSSKPPYCKGFLGVCVTELRTKSRYCKEYCVYLLDVNTLKVIGKVYKTNNKVEDAFCMDEGRIVLMYKKEAVLEQESLCLSKFLLLDEELTSPYGHYLHLVISKMVFKGYLINTHKAMNMIYCLTFIHSGRSSVCKQLQDVGKLEILDELIRELSKELDDLFINYPKALLK